MSFEEDLGADDTISIGSRSVSHTAAKKRDLCDYLNPCAFDGLNRILQNHAMVRLRHHYLLMMLGAT